MTSASSRTTARVSRRVGAISESATIAVTQKARRLRAEGRDVVGFGAGEPDFPTPAHVVEAAAAACRQPRNHKYTPTAGLPELREAIAETTERFGGPGVAPSQVLVTNGGKQAVYQAFATLLDPGDEVLVPAPYWVTYPEAIALAGGVPVAVPTDESTGFRVNPEMLERALTPRTKLLLFVSPSNPTGAVYTPEEVEAVGNWAAERGLWVLTDEIYQHLVYGGARFASLPAVVPALGDRWVVVHGVAKTFAMTGWRVGWMLGPQDVVAAAENLQSHLCSNVNNVAQVAAHAALTGPWEPVEEMREAFDRRRRRMLALLREMPGVTCEEPHGAFYCFPNLQGAMQRRRLGSSLELASWLLEEAGVAIVPGEAFGAPGYARLSYALSDEDLDRGLAAMAAALA